MSQKKSAKKMLFGKLMKPTKSSSSSDKVNGAAGTTSTQQEGSFPFVSVILSTVNSLSRALTLVP